MSEPPMPIRAFLIDDQALICEGLRALWTPLENIEIVGTTGDLGLAVEEVARLQPHIVILDIGVARTDSIVMIKLIVERFSATRVLVLSSNVELEPVIAALQAGASGYILKDMSASQIACAVDAAHHGTISMAPQIMRMLVHAALDTQVEAQPEVEAYVMRSALDAEGRERLSDRELKVLQLAAHGLTNREIGASLYVTEGTVKNHIASLLSKLHVRRRTQAVFVAKDLGLL